jgi:hypothetical protein
MHEMPPDDDVPIVIVPVPVPVPVPEREPEPWHARLGVSVIVATDILFGLLMVLGAPIGGWEIGVLLLGSGVALFYSAVRPD